MKAITATEASRLYQCTRGHIYNMALRDKWRRVRLHGRIYYHPTDVDNTLGRDATCQMTPM